MTSIITRKLLIIRWSMIIHHWSGAAIQNTRSRQRGEPIYASPVLSLETNCEFIALEHASAGHLQYVPHPSSFDRTAAHSVSTNYCPCLVGPRSRRDSASKIQQWICPELHHLESPISCWRNKIELSIYRCSNYWSVSHLVDNRYQHSF